jgi:hypothetical protein
VDSLCSVVADFDSYDLQMVRMVVDVAEAVVEDFVRVHQNISSLNHQVSEFVLPSQ